MIPKILGIRNPASHDQREGREGGQGESRDTVQSGYTPELFWRKGSGEERATPATGRSRSQMAQAGQSTRPTFLLTDSQERRRNSPTRSKNAALAVPRAEGATPSLVSPLSALDLE